MATTTKRIQRIQGPISALNAGQIGVENTADADLGFKMHGGKDGDGAVTKWLAKDKPARVSEMIVQDLAGSGERVLSVDGSGQLILASGLVVPEHKTTHQLGGSDALNVGGLSGALADGQKTNADLKTLRGEGSLASKIYSSAGLQNAWEWGSRIETEDGQLLQLNHDPVANTRTARITGGQTNPNAISNPDFLANTSGWTASSGTTFIRSGLSTSDWPEPFNLTDQSANQFSYCGRANKNTDAPFDVTQSGVLGFGQRYRVSGWINNLSGTSEIIAYLGGVVVANATAANTWIYFDTEITALDADVKIQSEPTGTENSIFYFAHFRAYALGSNEGFVEVDADGDVSFKDRYLTSKVSISENGESSLETTSQSIVGAINEVNGRLRDIDIDYTAASDATLSILSHGVTDGDCGSIEADVMAASKPGTEGAAFYHIAASWWYEGTLVIGEAQVVRTPWAPATNAAALDASEVVTVTASGSNILINFALETGARVVGHYNVLSVTIPEPPS